MKMLSAWLLISLSVLVLPAQQRGLVDFKHLGIRFTIPDGWVGQEMEGSYIIAHTTIPGLIILTPHQSQTLDQLRQEAAAGLDEGNGTRLMPLAEIEVQNAQQIAVEYGGMVEWQPSKGYGIGLLNPSGNGLYILALTSTAMYSPAYAQYAEQVRRSIQFYTPDNSGLITQWQNTLRQGRLTYMDSYYSPSYSDGGVSGGYSQKRIIELCRAGHFFYSNQSEMSISGSNVSGYDHSSNQGHGTWEIAVDVAGSPLLRLRFYDGDIAEYTLSYAGDALHLNGSRNYHTECEVCP